MRYIHITEDNIDKEHICCAMSGKQSLAKKKWLMERFDEGLVFYRSEERGKCFIEYIPAENAWVPIAADGWLYINCLWIAGSMKGHGYANDLLSECVRDAVAQKKKGICILCAEGRKREFLADPKFLAYKGFMTADISDCGINLMVTSKNPSIHRSLPFYVFFDPSPQKARTKCAVFPIFRGKSSQNMEAFSQMGIVIPYIPLFVSK